METRSIVELTDVAEVMQSLSQVAVLAILQYLRNQHGEQTYTQISSAMKIRTETVKFLIERLAGLGIVTSFDTSTFADSDAGLTSINPDMPVFARSILQAIWPDWNVQEEVETVEVLGQLI